MVLQELQEITDVLRACRQDAEASGAVDVQQAEMVTLARRAADAERALASERRRNCALNNNAKVAEQCRDAAEARATGWKVYAMVVTVVAVLAMNAAAMNARKLLDTQTTRTAQAQPSIARVESDPELGRAVVWYK